MIKKQFAITLLVLICSLGAYSQQVRISFTGKDNLTNALVQLDSVRIQNLTTFKDTVLRGPYVIDLGTTTGVEDGPLPLRTGFELSSNYSNPFTEQTRFQLSTATSGKIEVDLYSIVGGKMASFQMNATPGNHEFMLDGRGLIPGVYILVASNGQHAPSMRIMKCGTTVSSLPTITYNGSMHHNTVSVLRKGSSLTSYRFIGYAASYHPDSTLATPTADTTIQFRFTRIPIAPVITSFTTTSFAVQAGTTIRFEVKANDVNGDLSKILIDYNEDGRFDDSTVVSGGDAVTRFTYAFPQSGSFRPRACARDAREEQACKQLDSAITVVSMPALTTTLTTNITTNSATSGGTITSDGGTPVSARGVCWNTSPSPTILNSKTSDGSGMGSFASSLTGLTANSKYYVRAYATNSAGTGYGDEISFTTEAGQVPTLSTAIVTNITQTTATSGGMITSDGGTPVSARGVCWNTSPSPTILNSKTIDGSGVGSFTSTITGLTANTKYYVRAYATNSAGTGYGDEISFTTLQSGGGTITIGSQVWMVKDLDVTTYRNGDPIPQVTDLDQWKTLTTGAWCYYNNDSTMGAVYGKLYNWYAVNDPRGLAPAGWHVPTDAEWRTLEMSIGMSQSQADTVGWRGTDEGGKLKETGTLHWISPNTGATNSSGFTALPGGCRSSNGKFYDLGDYGYWWSSTESSATHAWDRFLYSSQADVSRRYYYKIAGFSVRCVQGQEPVLTTTTITNITQTSATSGGTITSDGGTPVTSRGVCWNTSPSPTILNSKTSDGSGMGSFASSLTGLTANTKYYVRSYATNSAGTGYGDEISFTTQQSSGGTVTIGSQVWMVKDLDVTTYRNGDPIPQVTDPTQWKNLTTGAWCYYNNDSATGAIYGKLYNWYAVNDPRGLAPAGWHVPTDAEWKTLEMSLGMSQASADSANYRGKDEGGKLKEAGTAHWAAPNEGATNSSGFTALGSGFRFGNTGNFSSINYALYFWTASEASAGNSWFRDLDKDEARTRRAQGTKSNGFSVRCVKD